MIKRIIFIILCLLLSLTGYSFAQSTAINTGINWLIANQNADKSWGGSASSSVILYQATTEIISTLRILDNTGLPYIDGLSWLNAQQVDSVDFATNRLIVRANAGLDTSNELNQLLAWRNTEGFWGLDGDYTNALVNTSLALLALRSASYSDSTVINNALNYLIAHQNTDGGFGFYPSTCSGCNDADDSNTYMTALVSTTLQQFQQTTSIATAVNKAMNYLIAHQNADGGFGSSPSTVYETALALISLIQSGQGQAQPLQNAINYLTTTQLSNGSWSDDPYSAASQKTLDIHRGG